MVHGVIHVLDLHPGLFSHWENLASIVGFSTGLLGLRHLSHTAEDFASFRLDDCDGIGYSITKVVKVFGWWPILIDAKDHFHVLKFYQFFDKAVVWTLLQYTALSKDVEGSFVRDAPEAELITSLFSGLWVLYDWEKLQIAGDVMNQVLKGHRVSVKQDCALIFLLVMSSWKESFERGVFHIFENRWVKVNVCAWDTSCDGVISFHILQQIK